MLTYRRMIGDDEGTIGEVECFVAYFRGQAVFAIDRSSFRHVELVMGLESRTDSMVSKTLRALLFG